MTVVPAAPVLSNRKIQRISLANFDVRKDEITKQLMEAATDLGFFMVEDTGVSQEEVPYGCMLLLLQQQALILSVRTYKDRTLLCSNQL